MEENVMKIYGNPFNQLQAKEYAPVVIKVLETIKNNEEPISVQSALKILDDASRIIPRITTL